MKFVKMHGCGNDYIYVNCMNQQIENIEKAAIELSDRHFGIGGDGIILICPSEVADFRMRMYNLDGSEGAMCGNGIRCVAKFVYDYNLTDKMEVAIETNAGIKYIKLNVENGKVKTARVDMGEPILEAAQVPVVSEKEMVKDEPVMVDGKEWRITCVSMGNPHAVTYVDDTASIDIEKIGPLFEHHEIFPDRVNTEFIQIVDRQNINMRVWERGSGETLACGTGACASVVSSVINGLTDNTVTVHLLGGDLEITYNQEDNHVYMTGPATIVFEGTVEGY